MGYTDELRLTDHRVKVVNNEIAGTSTSVVLSFYFHVTDILDNLRPVSPKPLLPGHIERVTTPVTPLTSQTGAAVPSNEADDHRSVAEQRNYERFLKINVRHITDGQVGYTMDTQQLWMFFIAIKIFYVMDEFWQFLIVRLKSNIQFC